MRTSKSTAYILWCQCTFSKWHRWMLNSRSNWKCLKAIAPCLSTMAWCRPSFPLALCIEKCLSVAQHFTSDAGWILMIRNILWYSSRHAHERHSRFWLSSFCTSNSAGQWWHSSKMVSKSTSWPQSWSEPSSCTQCQLGTQFDYWTRISTISLHVWRLLWNDQTSTGQSLTPMTCV